MPKLKPATQHARREHILDAAERCFARAGFHGTTMQDICREAHVSAGALYVYFGSKEALIDGIAERDRNKLAGELAELAEADDLIGAMQKLGERYTLEEPHHKRVLLVEIGAEATRNRNVGEIFRATDQFCKESFERLFERARADGRIAPSLEIKTIAQVLAVIGDGMFWRRAIDPTFDAKVVMPVLTGLLASMLNPTTGAAIGSANGPAIAQGTADADGKTTRKGSMAPPGASEGSRTVLTPTPGRRAAAQRNTQSHGRKAKAAGMAPPAKDEKGALRS